MQDQLTNWLGEGIRRGVVSAFFEGNYPRYVWYLEDGIVYEGRLVNRGKGEYKGYTLEEDEWPAGIGDFFAETGSDQA